MECYNYNRNDGHVRILDRYGIKLFATQPCAYGSGLASSKRWPLNIARLGYEWEKRYRVDFNYPEGSNKKVSVQVHLT
eukprot:CAMPEP_0197632542 /NCGR_PEP_ID=MMETSP1338-20131121/9241_1 /TAXON_ID=43686 ORGANISM="Pelagodinium beii, Strain RCC1491" /NCGR_SAMPLE_ID=MMETSP1338 /ASSEMBLY_ACC=CAM_ASM_000754 /LENGTH=77 /DNA_ID=CAMNT_0043204105 /DNA_START=86 /DNA_END=315 /DNA_ORIENTATION=-